MSDHRPEKRARHSIEAKSPPPSKPSHILSLPAELNLQIYLAPLDRFSIEALAQSCKAFYAIFFDHEPLIWKAERHVWQAQRNKLTIVQGFEWDLARDEFDFDKKLRELEKADPENLGMILKERKLRRKMTNMILDAGYGRDV